MVASLTGLGPPTVSYTALAVTTGMEVSSCWKIASNTNHNVAGKIFKIKNM